MCGFQSRIINQIITEEWWISVTHELNKSSHHNDNELGLPHYRLRITGQAFACPVILMFYLSLYVIDAGKSRVHPVRH